MILTTLAKGRDVVLGVALGLCGGLLPACGRLGFELLASDTNGNGGLAGADASPPGGSTSNAGGAGNVGSGAAGATGGSDAGAAGAGSGGRDAGGGRTANVPDGGGGTVAGTGGTGGTGATGGASAIDAGIEDGGPSPATASTLSAGFAHSCAVANGGKLYCWGSNASSALGGVAGTQSSSPALVLGPGTTGGFVDVAAGEDFACARHGDGSVVCWGFNEEGMLATTDTSIRPTPNPVSLGADAVQLAAKYRVVCALLSDGTLWCWGDNWEGQAGQDEPPPYLDALAPLQVPGSDWRSVATGQGHVCGIRSTGSLWCWGRNTNGELGQGTTLPDQIRAPTQVGTDLDWKMVYAGAFHTCGIRNDESLWCWGSNATYQLGLDDTTNPKLSPTRVGTDNDWTTVSLSPFHTCGVRRPGTLWCWGRNDEGQLGLPWSSPDPLRVPTPIGSATDWVDVSSGWMHTCARRADDSAWCTGENLDGRVGDGSTARPYAFVTVDPFP